MAQIKTFCKVFPRRTFPFKLQYVTPFIFLGFGKMVQLIDGNGIFKKTGKYQETLTGND